MRRSAGHCGHDECAISIAQVAVIGICCCCSQLWTPADALVTEENIYEDLSRSFDGNFIRLIPDLQFIIERVFERLQCGNPHDPLQCIRNQVRALERGNYVIVVLQRVLDFTHSANLQYAAFLSEQLLWTPFKTFTCLWVKNPKYRSLPKFLPGWYLFWATVSVFL